MCIRQLSTSDKCDVTGSPASNQLQSPSSTSLNTVAPQKSAPTSATSLVTAGSVVKSNCSITAGMGPKFMVLPW